MQIRWSAAVLTIAALALSACGSASVGSSKAGSTGADRGPVKLGVLGPLTGPASTYGVAERNGVQMAVDEVNSQGGLFGKKVQVEVRDDKGGDPSVATTQALQLVQSDHVAAVFGPIVNTAALAVAKMSDQLKVPLLGTLGATTPVVYPDGPAGKPYPWVFRVLVSSPVQVQTLVDYGTSKGWKRWAMIYENDAYGQPTVTDLQAALKASGGELVSKQAIAVDAADATAQALAVKAAKPDAVLVWSIQAPASKAVSALARVGLKTPILSSNAQVSPQFFQLAGPLADGIIATGLKAQFGTDPDVVAFKKTYTDTFKIDPTLWAFASYDAAKLYLSKVKALGTDDPDKLRSALESTDFTGITGTIKFTAQQHDGITPDDVTLVRLQGGKGVPFS